MELMIHSSNFLLPTKTTLTDDGPAPTYALVLLNQRLPRYTPLLWNRAQLRLCADGGANRAFDELPLFFPHEEPSSVRLRYKPDVIKGDMDSIRTEVLDFYTKMVTGHNHYVIPEVTGHNPVLVGCNVIHGTKVVDESQDQDTTDLHKCIAFIRDLEKSNLCILVAGALGGRFDHEVGNINVLCRFSTTRIVLLSDDCLIQLLPSTHRHEIHIHSSVEGPHCGLVPIGMPSASTTTTGLQWDLNDTEMRFGGLISTSNIVKGDIISVQSSSDLLWTISLKKPEMVKSKQ